jgi:hypothetical protein
VTDTAHTVFYFILISYFKHIGMSCTKSYRMLRDFKVLTAVLPRFNYSGKWRSFTAWVFGVMWRTAVNLSSRSSFLGLLDHADDGITVLRHTQNWLPNSTTSHLNKAEYWISIEYNWALRYHSLIWYAGSYMFRHPCAIFREILMPRELLESRNVYAVFHIQWNLGSRTPLFMNNSVHEQIFLTKKSRMRNDFSDYEHASW